MVRLLTFTTRYLGLCLILGPMIFLGAQDLAGDKIMEYLEKKQQAVGRTLSKDDRTQFEIVMRDIVARSLYERKKSVSQSVLREYTSRNLPRGVHRVYATSFGNPGNKGESNLFKDGTKVRRGVITAALPDNSAVGRMIAIRRQLKNGRYTNWIPMKVRDLGPWFRDDPYWLGGNSPRAVAYFKKKKKRWDGRVVQNPAGLDLTPWAWQKIGISAKDSINYSGYVEWKFL